MSEYVQENKQFNDRKKKIEEKLDAAWAWFICLTGLLQAIIKQKLAKYIR